MGDGFRGGRVALVCLAVILASACGSTVRLTPRQQQALDEGATSGLEGFTTGLDSTLDDDTAPPGVTGATGSRRTAAPTATGSVGPPPAPPGIPPPVSATAIKVGIAYVEDPGSANEAAGFSGIGQIDYKRGWDAMVREVNKNPPFGRKVEPVYYSYTQNDVITKGADQLYQEMCAHWTKDNRVFMAWVTSLDTLRSCLTKAGVAQLAGSSGFSYDKTFRDYPWYVEHNAAAQDRMAEFEVEQLVAKGFFAKCKPDPSTDPCVDGKPRIGLIRYDPPSFKAAAERMKKTLAKHGLSLCGGCEFEISYSNEDVAAQLDDATEVRNAIANCQTPKTVPGSPDTPAGPCTHMMFLGTTAGVRITLFYVQAAEDQRYRARLGFNSQDAPQAVANFWKSQGQPQYLNQFEQSILVGHTPADFNIKGGAFGECKKLFEAAGETFGGSDDPSGNKEGQIDGLCDSAWYYQAAMNAAGSNVNLDAWLHGVANTGVVKSAGTLLMRTTATRRDGAGAIRVANWFPECECFKAVTGDILV